jgi:hypothetical protein
MPYGFTPPSQRNRRISFDLSGGGADATMDLVIRPEELTRVEPSRLSVQQTLAGAWADAFDRGVATIRISGHTGWHGGSARGGAGGLSGEAQFQNLRTTSFQGWHDARSALVAGGQDPAAVEMLFIDELDRFSALVAPKVFTLRRSKTRPLLMMYVIELLVLQDLGDPGPGGGGAGGPGDAIAQAFGDFLAGAGALQGIAGDIAGVVGQANGIAGAAQGLGNQLANGNLLGAVAGAPNLVNQLAGGLNNAAGVGQNIGGTLAGLLGGLA